ncbi:MAG: FAD-dependent oxidoreductase, partial [archaeon]|nr:FAD-dependent oxidoreductase [archaeon]
MGAGHANLLLLRSLWQQRKQVGAVDVVLVSDSRETMYTGMVPGAVAGLAASQAASFCLPSLCQKYDACFIEASFQRLILSPNRHAVVLHRISSCSSSSSSSSSSLITLAFDIVVINVGSSLRGFQEIPGASRFALPTRPAVRLLDGLKAWGDNQKESTREWHLGVVGGGFAGVELAWCLHSRFASQHPASVTLYDSSPHLLAGESWQLQKVARAVCLEKGIRVENNAVVTEVADSHLLLADGRRFHCGLAVWATGPASPHC